MEKVEALPEAETKFAKSHIETGIIPLSDCIHCEYVYCEDVFSSFTIFQDTTILLCVHERDGEIDFKRMLLHAGHVIYPIRRLRTRNGHSDTVQFRELGKDYFTREKEALYFSSSVTALAAWQTEIFVSYFDVVKIFQFKDGDFDELSGSQVLKYDHTQRVYLDVQSIAVSKQLLCVTGRLGDVFMYERQRTPKDVTYRLIRAYYGGGLYTGHGPCAAIISGGSAFFANTYCVRTFDSSPSTSTPQVIFKFRWRESWRHPNTIAWIGHRIVIVANDMIMILSQKGEKLYCVDCPGALYVDVSNYTITIVSEDKSHEDAWRSMTRTQFVLREFLLLALCCCLDRRFIPLEMQLLIIEDFLKVETRAVIASPCKKKV
jgi:hypothetical protein